MGTEVGIRDRTETCQSLFTRCLSNPIFSDKELDWYESRQGELNLWASVLKATNIGRSSLEHRLRDNLEVRGRICGLLDGLSESLKTILQPEDESLSDSHSETGNPADSIFSGFSSDEKESSSLPSSNGDAGRFAEEKFLVKFILGQLARLSTSIRRSGTRYRHKRADDALREEGNMKSFADFMSYLAVLILVHKFGVNGDQLLDIPAASKRFTRGQYRLIHANIVRRNRIMFATASMNPPDQSPAKNLPVNTFEFNANEIVAEDTTSKMQPTEILQSSAPVPLQDALLAPEKPLTAPSVSRTATDLGSQFTCGHDTEPKKATRSVVTGITKIGATQDYPACPKPISDEILQCPYCGDMLPVDYSQNTSRWRGHIAQDVLPYFCFHENCQDAEMYLTSDDLFKHMLRQHGVMQWVCQDCSLSLEGNQYSAFPSQNEWQEHMDSEHPAFPASQILSLANVSQRMVLEALDCPLCAHTTEDAMTTLDDHIATHLHQFALLSLPWSPAGCSTASKNTKPFDAAVSNLSMEDDEDDDSGHLDLSGAKAALDLTIVFGKLVNYIHSKSAPDDPLRRQYDSKFAARLISAHQRCFHLFSETEKYLPALYGHPATQPSEILSLNDQLPLSSISSGEEAKMSGNLKAYPAELSVPEIATLIEQLSCSIMKITSIQSQAHWKWIPDQIEIALGLFCMDFRNSLEQGTSSINLEEAREHWHELTDEEREPYHEKSKDEIKSIEEHRARLAEPTMMMLENELHILENLLSSHSEEGGLLHDQQTESDTSSQCLRYLRLSDPRTEKARLQESAGAQLPESSSWVFKTSQFKQWYADKDVCILRIKGSPGSGKTILLYHMIDRLTSFEEVGVCAFFFCRDVDKSLSSAHAVLRGMIFMLVEQLPSLLSHVLDKYNHQEIEPLDRFGSWNTLLDIFFNILLDPNVKIAYLIVDALDECNTDLPKLLDLIQMTSKLFRVKWIVSSRDWYNLTEILERTGQNRFLDIDLDAKNTTRNESLTAYIHHKTRTFAKLTGCDLETQKRMLDRICSSADGNYLWVNSMFRELESSHPRDAMNILESVPEDLFSAYSEMMVRIEASDYADRCKLLLITMTVVYPPPTLQHLVLLFDGSNKMSTEVWTEHELKETIAQSSGFLTICNKTLTFSHQSKRTFCIHYYLSQQISGDLFEVSYLSLFVQSIKVLSGTLRHNLYNAQTPGTTGARIKTPDPDPLSAIAYSCLYWVDHFISLRSDLRSQDDVNLLVAKFLTYHGLHWVEALSLLGRLSDGIDAMEKLENALDDRWLQSATIIRDIRRFLLRHRWFIDMHPLQLYSYALIFSPRTSMLHSGFQADRPLWIKSGHIVGSEWSESIKTLEGSLGAVLSVAFSPDGNKIASVSGCAVWAWDVRTAERLACFEGHSSSVLSVAFSPDGKQIISGASDMTVQVWEISTLRCIAVLEGHSNEVTSVAFSPDGQRIASSSLDKTIRIWNISTTQCLMVLKGHDGEVQSVAFSPDGKKIASASVDQIIFLWCSITGHILLCLQGHNSTVSAVAFSPDGKYLASASNDHTVKIWSIVSGTCLGGMKLSASVLSVAFSPDGSQVISTSGENVELWSVHTRQSLRTFRGHRDQVRSIAFSPDGQQIMSGSLDHTIQIWAADATQQIIYDRARVSLVVFSSTGRWLASISDNLDKVQIWDVATHDCIFHLHDPGIGVQILLFSPGAECYSPHLTYSKIASGSNDGSVKLWKLVRGEIPMVLKGHSSAVTALTFSSDGEQLISASEDRTIRMWDVATGQCKHSMQVNMIIRDLSYRLGLLMTDVGVFDLSFASNKNRKTSQMLVTAAPSTITDELAGEMEKEAVSNNSHFGFNFDSTWITFKGQYLLSLPSEYRPSAHAIFQDTVAIGCASGQFIIIEFDADLCP